MLSNPVPTHSYICWLCVRHLTLTTSLWGTFTVFYKWGNRDIGHLILPESHSLCGKARKFGTFRTGFCPLMQHRLHVSRSFKATVPASLRNCGGTTCSGITSSFPSFLPCLKRDTWRKWKLQIFTLFSHSLTNLFFILWRLWDGRNLGDRLYTCLSAPLDPTSTWSLFHPLQGLLHQTQTEHRSPYDDLASVLAGSSASCPFCHLFKLIWLSCSLWNLLGSPRPEVSCTWSLYTECFPNIAVCGFPLPPSSLCSNVILSQCFFLHLVLHNQFSFSSRTLTHHTYYNVIPCPTFLLLSSEAVRREWHWMGCSLLYPPTPGTEYMLSN